MNDYRERLEAGGVIQAFERARAAKNATGMEYVLRRSGFTEPEIESILWSNGENVTRALTAEEKKQGLRNEIVGRLGIALISGLIGGGAMVYLSSGAPQPDERHVRSQILNDYRRPRDAYYRPFMWGLCGGTILGLIGGMTVIGALLVKRKR